MRLERNFDVRLSTRAIEDHESGSGAKRVPCPGFSPLSASSPMRFTWTVYRVESVATIHQSLGACWRRISESTLALGGGYAAAAEIGVRSAAILSASHARGHGMEPPHSSEGGNTKISASRSRL